MVILLIKKFLKKKTNLWTKRPIRNGAGGNMIFCKHCNVCRINRNPACSRESKKFPPWYIENPNSDTVFPV